MLFQVLALKQSIMLQREIKSGTLEQLSPLSLTTFMLRTYWTLQEQLSLHTVLVDMSEDSLENLSHEEESTQLSGNEILC